MLEAYFDESGTHEGADITCVAGYVFESLQRVRFEEEWLAVLNGYGLKTFHMSDCAHGTGAFKKISKADRIEVCKRLIGAIKRRARIGLTCSVCEIELRQFQEEFARSEGHAYTLCLNWCIAAVSAWVHHYSISDRIAYFFEAGHRQQSAANAYLQRIPQNPLLAEGCRYQSHTFIRKQDAVAIHAPDLLAWEWHREWVNRFGLVKRQQRASLSSLLEMTHMSFHFGNDELLDIAEDRFDSVALRTIKIV